MMFNGKFVAGTEGAQPAFDLRYEVFVTEQGFPAECERDEHDAWAHHLMIFVQEQCIAAGRGRAPGGYF